MADIYSEYLRDIIGLPDATIRKLLLIEKLTPDQEGEIAKILQRQTELFGYTPEQLKENLSEIFPQLSKVDTAIKELLFEAEQNKLLFGQWHVDEHGVWMKAEPKKSARKKKTSEDDEAEEVRIEATSTPCIPVAELRNIDTGEYKTELAFVRGSDVMHASFNNDMLLTASKVPVLSKSGVNVSSNISKCFVQYIYDLLKYSKLSIPQKLSSSSMGWTSSRKFIPYDSEIVFDGNQQGYYKSFTSQAGTLEEWVAFMKPYRSIPQFRLCLDAVFAAPLVGYFDALPFVFHLFGESGCGKTVTLKACVSAWGNANCVQSANSTTTFTTSSLAELRNLPFAVDELSQLKVKQHIQNYDSLVLAVTQGTDRGRADVEGHAKPTQTWKNAFISTDEYQITSDTSTGGVKNRCIEVECEKGMITKTQAADICSFIIDHHGTAGREFIRLVQSGDVKGIKLRDLYTEAVKDLDGMFSEVGSKQIPTAALLYTADVITSVLMFEDNPIPLDALGAYLKSEEEVDVAERAYQFIESVIAENHDHFEQQCNAGYWGKRNSKGTFFIYKRLREELEAGNFEFSAVAKRWTKKGYIKKFEKRKGHSEYATQCKIYGVNCDCVQFPNLKADTDDRNHYADTE